MIDDQWLAAQLITRGLVTQAQIQEAQKSGSGDLTQSLIAAGAVQEVDLLRFLGQVFQTRYITTEKLSTAKIPQWVMDLVPMELCEEYLLLPVRCDREKQELSIVTSDPSDEVVKQSVQQVAGVQSVQAFLALRHAVETGVRRYYKGDIHAFARMDQALRQNYSELLSIYEQRLIDFDQDEPSLETASQPRLTTEAARPSGEAPRVEISRSSPIEGSPLPTRQATGLHPGLDPLAQPRPVDGEPWTPDPEGMVQLCGVLVNLLETGQGWRQGHTAEIARLASLLAGHTGAPTAQQRMIGLAAHLHDLGKPLDHHLTLLYLDAHPEQASIAHGVHGTPGKLLASAQLPTAVWEILASLYERFDGQGAPGKLSGEGIPVGARIIAVADAYADLLTNPRAPGGRAEAPEEALQRLVEATARGIFDPQVIAHLERVLAETIQQQGTNRRRRILVIDGDLNTSALLEQRLSGAGYEVKLVRSTAEAALVVLSESVDLVLSEVQLEPVDGFAFLQRLRSDPRTRALPFLFVSERSDAEDVNRGFELGALDYIVKPYAPEVLVAKIRRVLE